MHKVRLSELVRPAGKRAGPEISLPVYSVTKHDGFVPSLEYFKKAVFARDVSKYKLVEPGQFAYATIHLDEGSIGIAPERALISPMYTVFQSDKSQVDPQYLLRYLKSPRALAEYTLLGRGAVHRRKSISLTALGTLQVPLPALEEQQRIADILDRADELCESRHRILKRLDELKKAIFLEWFGDPLDPTVGYEREKIGEIATVVTGNTPSRKLSENYGDYIEWIKSDNLGGTLASEGVEKLSEQGLRTGRKAPPGSVLVCCIAGSQESIGKASIIDREVAFNQQINAILPSTLLDPIFLLNQLKVRPELVRRKSTNGMKGLVSKSAFQTIEIVKPPLATQKRFASVIDDIDKSYEMHTKSVVVTGELFASLQSRAFRGEL